jgi:hypothetical protein
LDSYNNTTSVQIINKSRTARSKGGVLQDPTVDSIFTRVHRMNGVIVPIDSPYDDDVNKTIANPNN